LSLPHSQSSEAVHFLSSSKRTSTKNLSSSLGLIDVLLESFRHCPDSVTLGKFGFFSTLLSDVF